MSMKGRYRPDIDGLRAAAVLSVMLYHLKATLLPGGFVGVDVFFVISGFVVTSSLVANPPGSLSGFVGEFYARRLARILPALVLVLVASAFAATLFIPKAWLSDLSEQTAKYAFFGLSNWVMQSNSDFYFAPRAEFNPYVQTWSLGVEEQFYLITPFLVYIWIRSLRSKQGIRSRATIGGLFFLSLLSLLACAWATDFAPIVAFYFIGCRLWELGAGVLLFLCTFKDQEDQDEVEPVQGGSGWQNATALVGAACLGLAFLYADMESFPWPWALLPVAGTLLLIQSSTTRPCDPVRRILASAVAVWIGKRSYSLYLWHWPVYVLMRWTIGLETAWLMGIAVATTFGLSIFSYRWVEQPLRHNLKIEAWPKVIRIAFFVLLPICGYLLATNFFDHRRFYSLSIVSRNQLDWYASVGMGDPDTGGRQCKVRVEWHSHSGSSERRYVPSQCRDGVQSRTIYVLGDSHAAALGPALYEMSAANGILIRTFVQSGCSYLGLMRPLTKASAGCLEFVRSVTREVVETSQPGDQVLLPSLRLLRYSDQWGASRVKEMFPVMYSPANMASREESIEDAQRWLQQLADAHLEVFFVAPSPIFRAPAFRCSDWFNRMNPICHGNNEQLRSELEALRAPVLENMTALSQIFPNLQVWDPFPLLCPEEVCRTHMGGRPLFFDGDHLSGYGNLFLYPHLSEFLIGNSLQEQDSGSGLGSPKP